MIEPKRRFKAGVKPQYSEGRISEHRTAWLETYIGQFNIMEYDAQPDDMVDNSKREVGTVIRLMIPKNGRATFYNLTALTEAELTSLRQFFNLLFDKAEPVVQARDKVAQNALANGDDSFHRCYRSVPRLVIRERKSSDDNQGVHDGPESSPEGDRPAED